MITNQKVTLGDIVVQAKGNIVSDMGGEKVMLSVAKGKYYNLGDIGGEIWDLISSPMEVKQVMLHLTSSYQVEQEVCESQVISFLEQLINEELIVINN